MPRLRHRRLALLAVAVAVVFALAPRTGPAAPTGAAPVAAAPAVPSPDRPSVARLPRPDPGGARDELGLIRPISPAALTGYVSPLPRGRLTLPFGASPWGSRIVHGEAFHDGIDLATFCGDRIVAAHAGTVLAAGRRYDAHMGWLGDLRPYTKRLDEKHAWGSLPIVVVIDDGNGYRSLYAHFARVVVKAGQSVEAGQLIGYEGATGRASGCHLHYGLFSPLETAVIEIDPTVVKRMALPRFQVARIDPLLVLPKKTSPPRVWPPTRRPSTPIPAIEPQPLD